MDDHPLVGGYRENFASVRAILNVIHTPSLALEWGYELPGMNVPDVDVVIAFLVGDGGDLGRKAPRDVPRGAGDEPVAPWAEARVDYVADPVPQPGVVEHVAQPAALQVPDTHRPVEGSTRKHAAPGVNREMED